MKFLRWFLGVLIVAVIAAVLAVVLIPWNSVLEGRIVAMLSAKGFNNISLKVDHVGFHDAALSDIVVGAENPLRLSSLKLEYSLKELLSGELRDITLSGLNPSITETDAGWVFSGIDALAPSSGEEKAAWADLLQLMPVARIKIEDSRLGIQGKTVQGDLPFNLAVAKLPSPSLSLVAQPSQITVGVKTISLGAISADLTPDAANRNIWSGTWAIASIDAGKDVPVPILKGSGKISVEQPNIVIDGDFMSDDRTHKARISASLNTEDASRNTITLVSASFPFKGGIVSTKNVILKQPMTVPVSVQKVSVDELIGALTGHRVTATGTFSGSIPVIIAKDGSFTLGQGSLKADSDGLIQMPGDAIPGDNEQIALVREILENLQYSLLSASVKSGQGRKITVQLSLEGKNPDVYGGRPVKLNVNLTGDVLDFIQQNIMLFNAPETLLKQELQ